VNILVDAVSDFEFARQAVRKFNYPVIQIGASYLDRMRHREAIDKGEHLIGKKLLLIDLVLLDPAWRVLLFVGIGVLFLVLSYWAQSLWRPSLQTEADPGDPGTPGWSPSARAPERAFRSRRRSVPGQRHGWSAKSVFHFRTRYHRYGTPD